MIDFKHHEQFEIEVLKLLAGSNLLTHLVFGGGTCLRLCFSLKRYSVDLDFWQKSGFTKKHFEKMKSVLGANYEITDSYAKHFSYLIEIRSPDYPKKLKIEIRKGEHMHMETELNVAYSFFTDDQIRLNTLTLKQIGLNKVKAFLNRHEIRDAYDLEFIYKKGQLNVADVSDADKKEIVRLLDTFTAKDYKVKLGSLLEAEDRNYYTKKGFAVLKNAMIT